MYTNQLQKISSLWKIVYFSDGAGRKLGEEPLDIQATAFQALHRDASCNQEPSPNQAVEEKRRITRAMTRAARREATRSERKIE